MNQLARADRRAGARRHAADGALEPLGARWPRTGRARAACRRACDDDIAFWSRALADAIAGVRDEPAPDRADATTRLDALAGARRCWPTTCGSSSSTTGGAACSRSATGSPMPTVPDAPTAVLRPAGLGGAPGELRRDRQGRRAAAALVPPGAARDEHRRPRDADVVGRHDVRVPDAAAADAQLSRHAARPELPRERAAADRIRQAPRTCRGASPSRRTALTDRAGTYQYKAFGVPGLGLKRGLEDDLVIAPYATALASLVDPGRGRDNLERLARAGARRAVRVLRGDRLHRRARRTPTARRRRRPAARPRSSGPSSPSPGHVARRAGQRRVRRRVRAPLPRAIRACRRPSCCCRSACRARPSSPSRGPPKARRRVPAAPVLASRRFRSPHTREPAHALPVERPLHHGGDARRRRVQRVARPRGDAPARGPDIGCGRALHLPARSVVGRGVVADLPADGPRAGRATTSPSNSTRRRSAGATATSRRGCEIAVSPEDDVEVRRLSITNHGDRPREIEVTSYAEIVLAPARGRLRASGIRQAVRRDRARRAERRAAVQPAAAQRGRAARLGLSRARRRRPARRGGRVGDRPRAVHRPRTIDGQPDRARRARRCRARPAPCWIPWRRCAIACGSSPAHSSA